MSKPIWEKKREEKQNDIGDLISQLKAVGDNEAQILISALHYYGTKPEGMPQTNWVVIRRELVDKARAMIKGAQK